MIIKKLISCSDLIEEINNFDCTSYFIHEINSIDNRFLILVKFFTNDKVINKYYLMNYEEYEKFAITVYFNLFK